MLREMRAGRWQQASFGKGTASSALEGTGVQEQGSTSHPSLLLRVFYKELSLNA